MKYLTGLVKYGTNIIQIITADLRAKNRGN